MASEKIFDVTIPADMDPEAGVKMARKKAREVGITLEGDTAAGTFSGTADGTYTLDGHKLRFEVTKKPFFVSWGMVESGLKKIFGDVTTA